MTRPRSSRGRAILQSADAGLDAAVVARPVRGREQALDAMSPEKVLHRRGGEVAAVVALEHQRRTVRREERCQRQRRVLARRRVDRLPEQLHAAGQVANRQDRWQTTVDGDRRLGIIDRPDTADHGPVQHAQRLAMSLSPDAAIALQEILKLGSAHVGKALAQRRHADLRAKLIEEVNDGVALFARRTDHGTPQWQRRPELIQQIVTPLPQRAASDLNEIGDLRPCPAETKKMSADLGGMTAGVVFALTTYLLMSAAATLRRRMEFRPSLDRRDDDGGGRRMGSDVIARRASMDNIPGRGRQRLARWIDRHRGQRFFA